MRPWQPAAAQGLYHHSDRGSQYAAEDYHTELEKHGLRGSMARRGNPYDNAKAESFMKTLKWRRSTLWSTRPSRTWQPHCRASSTSLQQQAAPLRFGYRSPAKFEQEHTPRWSNPQPDPVHSRGAHSKKGVNRAVAHQPGNRPGPHTATAWIDARQCLLV
jgi:transposase InsO family protein